MRSFLSILFVVFTLSVCPGQEALKNQRISVHDPVMINQDGIFYLYCTGMGISVWSSPDLKTWKREKPVFSAPPPWAVETIPGFRGHIWAPDISFHNGYYYLYYSVSAFGKNTSCIGLAINKTINPADPLFKWEDEGKVIQSFPEKTSWNAIDPNLVFDNRGKPWLVFGSFWDGLQMIKMKKDLRMPAEGSQPVTVASRKSPAPSENRPVVDNNPADSGDNAIEAPFIVKKGKYFYLFASIDYCCKGVNSTYKMIVGRSRRIGGPYLDKERKPLRYGGGSILMAGDADWYGVGHNGICTVAGNDYILFHGYDAKDNGRAKLLIYTINWDAAGWPLPGDPLY
jgi:arabinan endo-1,5-alpha-L-arabinosidase